MHPILTQGVPPNKGTIPHTSQASDPETTTFASNRAGAEANSKRSFIAIFEGAAQTDERATDTLARLATATEEETQELAAPERQETEDPELVHPKPGRHGGASSSMGKSVAAIEAEITNPAEAETMPLSRMPEASGVQNTGTRQNSEQGAPQAEPVFGSQRNLRQDTSDLQQHPHRDSLSVAGESEAGEEMLRPSHRQAVTGNPMVAASKQSAEPASELSEHPVLRINRSESKQATEQVKSQHPVPAPLQLAAEAAPQVAALSFGAKTAPAVTSSAAAPIPVSTTRKAFQNRAIDGEPVFQNVPIAKTSPPIPTQPTEIAMSQVQSVAFGQSEAGKLSTSMLDAEPILGPRSDFPQSISTLQSHVTQPNTPLPQYIARQIAEALQHLPNRPVEIMLNPEELGRVRLAVSTSEAGIVVNILAERQETVELMRRHIAILEGAFQDIGYDDISFSFSGGDQTSEDADIDQSRVGASESSTEGEALPPTPNQINLTSSTQAGLDIRL